MNPLVDDYFEKLDKWQDELQQLRKIVLECGLLEELKWSSPCYTFQQHNVAIIGGLKESCVLSFFKGALLQDSHQLLKQPGEHTQSARTIHFTNIQEISKWASVLKSYIFEAIEIEKAGLKVDFTEKDELIYPEELLNYFSKMPELAKAFEALTPGKQRAYILHFTQAKQSATRLSRIEKCVPQILMGKGYNEEYLRK